MFNGISKKATFYTLAVAVVAVAVAVMLWPKTVEIRSDGKVDMSSLTLTLWNDEGIQSYSVDESGRVVLGHGYGSIGRGLIAIHSKNEMYWEGLFEDEQTSIILIKNSEKRPMTKEVVAHLKASQ